MEKNRFRQLLESTIGNVKPLISENELDEDKINLSGTYLDPKIRSIKSDYEKKNKNDKPTLYQKTGKIFKNNQTTNIDGISFDKIDSISYMVNFSREFLEKYFSEPISKQDINYSPYDVEHNPETKVPMKVGNRKVDEILKKDIIIMLAPPINKIHFVDGIPPELRGIGLGYIIYKEFIKYIGYASSLDSASLSAQNVWYKLAQDSDFYTVIIKSNKSLNAILVIYKNIKSDNPVDIVNNFLNWFSSDIDDETIIKIGDNFINDYPNIKTIVPNII